MHKRGREEPCFVCNHYHDYAGGEPCPVCGHVLSSGSSGLGGGSGSGDGGLADGPAGGGPSGRWSGSTGSAGGACGRPPPPPPSKEPTLILQDFLYLGGYDAASRCELLKAYGVTHVLNLVPGLPPLFKNTFAYHTASCSPPSLPECFDFLDRCLAEERRVLVYCMTGQSKSPTVVIAYLMKVRGWRLAESYRWVKDRRPAVKIGNADFRRLQEAEVELHGNCSVDRKEMLDAIGTGGPFQLPSGSGGPFGSNASAGSGGNPFGSADAGGAAAPAATAAIAFGGHCGETRRPPNGGQPFVFGMNAMVNTTVTEEHEMET